VEIHRGRTSQGNSAASSLGSGSWEVGRLTLALRANGGGRSHESYWHTHDDRRLWHGRLIVATRSETSRSGVATGGRMPHRGRPAPYTLRGRAGEYHSVREARLTRAVAYVGASCGVLPSGAAPRSPEACPPHRLGGALDGAVDCFLPTVAVSFGPDTTRQAPSRLLALVVKRRKAAALLRPTDHAGSRHRDYYGGT